MRRTTWSDESGTGEQANTENREGGAWKTQCSDGCMEPGLCRCVDVDGELWSDAVFLSKIMQANDCSKLTPGLSHSVIHRMRPPIPPGTVLSTMTNDFR